MNLSIFKGWTDETPVSITLDAIVEMMRTDASLKDLTDKHRYYSSLGDKVSAKYYKQRMPCFGVAVRFEGGKSKEHIAALTGLTIVDIDDIAPDDMPRMLTLIRQDPHTVLAYTTISGNGIRVITRYACDDDENDNENENRSSLAAHSSSPTAHGSPLTIYKQAFLQVNAYYAELTGLQPDPLCKNITRLSGAAYDIDLYYNPDATPFRIKVEEKRRVGRPRGKRTAEQAERQVLRQLELRGIRYEPGSHNRFISQAGYLMNRYGVPEDDCVEWASARFADYAATGNNVAGIIHSCYQQTAEHGTERLPTDKKDSFATVAEIEDWLTAKNIRIRYNVISRKWEVFDENADALTAPQVLSPSHSDFHRTECINRSSASFSAPKALELTDRFVNSLYRAFSLETGRRLRISDLHIVIESDFYPEYHPMKDYLESLPDWDGYDYIEELANRVHVAPREQELHNRFFKKWFVAMIAAWFESDKTNHEILTYIGAQGIYKSTFMRMLLPPVLRDYFSARNFSHRMNKDDRIELSEMALIALEELDNMKPHELNQLKAITTDPAVNERAAYARYRERRDHIASFCGTGNNPHFLSDITGNRRWLPFIVDNIDSPYEHPFNYIGLYSQAYSLWLQGFPYWFSHEENAELEVHNKQFEEPCMEEELILTYLRKPYESEVGEFLTASRIIELIGQSVRTSLQPRHVAIVMKRLGFEQRRTRVARGWNVVILTGDEIKNNQRQNAHQSSSDD